MVWLTAAEALAALGVQRQTLYANVSRGRIRAKPDPKDSRKSLYDGADVKRLARRRVGRRSAATIAAEAIRWGDPILPSSVSTVVGARLLYRGFDAAELAERASLEDIAGLLWMVEAVEFRGASRRLSAATDSPLQAGLAALADRAGADPPSLGRSRLVLAAEGAALVGDLADAMMGPSAGPSQSLHRRMAVAWRARDAEDRLRRALVLLADHELNASTFAARVAASTGAPVSAALLAGLATLSGPRHGGAANAMRALIAAVRRDGAKAAVRDWLALARPLPGFGHPLYPDGDPRAVALLTDFKPGPAFADLRAEVEALIGEKPNVDFAIAALASAFDLPPAAPLTIFAIARSVGWVAHVLEQAASGVLIRPRARYVGPGAAREAT
ncbi:MAG TPA: citrate synthase [Roseiarcus sp.]|nr:citrate synthase [Roseiarcus sp.]